MQQADPLIRTKLHPPFTRAELVVRPRLQEQIAQGLRRPLTLIIAPAGFGKTTLVAFSMANCEMPVAWLSLDKSDNEAGRFVNYLVAALQEADHTIGSEAAQLLGARQVAAEAVLASVINELDSTGREIVLVLDDYQFINSQAVHEAVTFLLEHCPLTLHMVLATRSDPALPVARLRARGQMVELRAVDLSFSEHEATQFLNDVMDLRLDAASIAVLAERTEGWIAGLQMAALSMRDREDVPAFIEGFSGTNRYILDYLLEEVLASQPAEVRYFLLNTSILERLSAPLCDAILANEHRFEREGDDRSSRLELPFAGQPAAILAYLEQANLFLVPLDDERIWYRYHHLFADLLRAQLQRSLGAEGVARLHVRAADWHGQNGSILEAIHHAAMAADDERVERFIEQHYRELVSRGEQSWLRSWTAELSEEVVYRRPWLCIYEAYSHSWFGELDQADRLLEAAEQYIGARRQEPDADSMNAHLAYVRSRVTAMRGDLQRAIKLCVVARELMPDSNLALQLDTLITLGYEYFLSGDYANAAPILNETIGSGRAAGAVINTVAASCLMARLYAVQGLLNRSYDTYRTAAQFIPGTSGQHRGARALVEVGIADVLCERNDLDAALVHLTQGLDLLPFWDKADDLALAYIILSRIHLAQGHRRDAAAAIEKAVQLLQRRGIFCEAREAVQNAQVRLWLAEGDLQAANRWVASLEKRAGPDDQFTFENELAHITQARVLIALKKPHEAAGVLCRLKETARSAGRMGRVIEILLLQAVAMQEQGDSESAHVALTECLTLAEPEGYARIFLDEGQPVQLLLAQWATRNKGSPVRHYANQIHAQFDPTRRLVPAAANIALPADSPGAISKQPLVEPLSPRELEVLSLIARGKTNKEIARQLIVAPGTVKAHTSSIYRKLDVANRTEAAARSKELGILP